MSLIGCRQSHVCHALDVRAQAFQVARGLLAAALSFGTLTRCGEDEGASCDDLVVQASNTRVEAVESASLVCSQDEDCVLGYYGLDCLDDCGTRVLLGRADVSAVESAAETANSTYCKQFDEMGCVVIPNPCVLPVDVAIPVCRNGQCEVEVQSSP
jgi:hypothetical protein